MYSCESRFVITRKGIDYFENLLVDPLTQLANNVSNIKIDDVINDASKLRNIKINNVTLPKPKITIVPDKGLEFEICAKDLDVTGDYSLKVAFWWSSGKLELTADITVKLEAGAHITDNKTLVLSSKLCAVTFHEFELDMDNLLLNVAAGFLTDTLKGRIRDAICPPIQAKINAISIPLYKYIPNE